MIRVQLHKLNFYAAVFVFSDRPTDFVNLRDALRGDVDTHSNDTWDLVDQAHTEDSVHQILRWE